MKSGPFVPLLANPLGARRALVPLYDELSSGRVALESPALSVMTDLRKMRPATIEPRATIDEAREHMRRSGVRLLLVMDQPPHLEGVITLNDILGERPMQFTLERAVRHAEIRVSDMMTPREDLEVHLLDDVERSRVGDVVAFLRKSGRQHALVAEPLSEANVRIVGIFSGTQIARQLGMPVDPALLATSFAELERALAAT